MKLKTRREINFLTKVELAAQRCKKGKDWKGYKVYEPVYKKPACIGLPLVVLVKDSEVRLSTREECFQYLDFAYSDESDEE